MEDGAVARFLEEMVIQKMSKIQDVRKYRPQNDHVERSDLAKRFFIAGWERERGREQREPRVLLLFCTINISFNLSF
jgi:hypothetical protein